MSISQIRKNLISPTPAPTFAPTQSCPGPHVKMSSAKEKGKKSALVDSDSEDDEPVPWTLDALSGDYSDVNIISTLTKPDIYTYNTQKSKKALKGMFANLCKAREEDYLMNA